ncbi:MAG TPA: helix-turn-helix domain-containing protein [Gemmatimonadales bacterium]|nr:helix-turn-helix domain-containing protein [Gemmatimonadales bacterium]
MEIRDRLLDAAVRLYAESGFRGATTRRIALAAGVNEITLFRHFGSKAALIQEAIQRAGLLGRDVPLPDEPGEPREELLAWSREHLARLRERRTLVRTCMAEVEEHPEMVPPEGSSPARAAQALCRYVERLRAQGRAAADFDPAAAAAMLMGALFADAMGRDLMPDMYRNAEDEALGQYVHLFLRAIGTSEASEA